jgi:hypothetical protein
MGLAIWRIGRGASSSIHLRTQTRRHFSFSMHCSAFSFLLYNSIVLLTLFSHKNSVDQDKISERKQEIMSDDESFVDVSVAQDGGIKKKILTAAPEGALGPPPNGNEVEAHYTGEFLFSSCFPFLLSYDFVSLLNIYYLYYSHLLIFAYYYYYYCYYRNIGFGWK